MQRENESDDGSQKVAVITGSSKEIGKAIAIEFAKAGYKRVLNARDEEELIEAVNDVKKTIGATEERVTCSVGNISQESICISLIEYTTKVFGSIDVLVNNASIGGTSKSGQELTSDKCDYVVDVNLKGAFLCIREAIKKMTNGDKSTIKMYSIINISSVHESIPQPQSVPYPASKGGVEMLTKTVALEWQIKASGTVGLLRGQ